KIKEQSVPLSANTKIDKKIIYGFTAFLVLISSLIFFTFYQETEYSTVLNTNLSFVKDLFNISDSLKSSLILGFMMFNIMAVLLIVDKLLNAKKLKDLTEK